MERTVLIVGQGEDATVAEEILDTVGYSVEKAEHDEALRTLQKLRPYLLLLEIVDRGILGATTQRIRATSAGSVLPIAFFGPAPGPNPVEVVALGGDVYLPTPVAKDTLLERVQGLVGPPPTKLAAVEIAVELDAKKAGATDPARSQILPAIHLDDDDAGAADAPTPASEPGDPPPTKLRRPTGLSDAAAVDDPGEVSNQIRSKISAFAEKHGDRGDDAFREGRAPRPSQALSAVTDAGRSGTDGGGDDDSAPDGFDLDALEVDTQAGVELPDRDLAIQDLGEELARRPDDEGGTPPPVVAEAAVEQSTPAPAPSPYDLPPVALAPAGTDGGSASGDHQDTVIGRRGSGGSGAGDQEGVTQPPEPRAGAASSAPSPGSDHPPSPPAAASDVDVPRWIAAGSFADVDPARVFWAIRSRGLTGRLMAEADAGRYHVYFDAGRPRFAQSSRPEDRMLVMLRREGKISAEQAADCEEEMVSTGRRAGAILLDRGWMKGAELIPTVRRHMESSVYEVFAQERTSYRFDAGITDEEIVGLERPISALILEGVRRKYRQERLDDLLGGGDVVPAKAPDADEAALEGADLSGSDWRVIESMDGRRSLPELAEACRTDLHSTSALIWTLTVLGLVTLPRHGRSGPTDTTPDAEGFRIDMDRVMARHQLVREGDYFAILGVDTEATLHEIRAAHKRAVADFTPEALHEEVRKRLAAELAAIRDVLDEAGRVLGRPTLLEEYRRSLVPGAAR